MSAVLELPSGETLALDPQGHLADWTQWNRTVAEVLAAGDGIELEAGHWQVIGVLRAYYGDYEIAPPMRALTRILQKRTGDASIGSRELYRLFPDGPAKQGCRYAGLPRPVSCI